MTENIKDEQFAPDDVVVIKSRQPGEDPIILKPVIYKGVKVYTVPIPGWEKFFPKPEKAE